MLSVLKRPGPRFARRFAAIAGVLSVLYYFPYEQFGGSGAWSRAYLGAYARLVGFVLSLAEPTVQVIGTHITGRFSMEIVKNCDAMDVMILFSSAMLALPGPRRPRLFALALGVAGIVAANVVRITSLYYVGVYAPDWFELAHLELWPLGLVLFTTVQFLLWARWSAEPRAATPA